MGHTWDDAAGSGSLRVATLCNRGYRRYNYHLGTDDRSSPKWRTDKEGEIIATRLTNLSSIWRKDAPWNFNQAGQLCKLNITPLPPKKPLVAILRSTVHGTACPLDDQPELLCPLLHRARRLRASPLPPLRRERLGQEGNQGY
jgi:hypothetical protein